MSDQWRARVLRRWQKVPEVFRRACEAHAPTELDTAAMDTISVLWREVSKSPLLDVEKPKPTELDRSIAKDILAIVETARAEMKQAGEALWSLTGADPGAEAVYVHTREVYGAMDALEALVKRHRAPRTGWRDDMATQVAAEFVAYLALPADSAPPVLLGVNVPLFAWVVNFSSAPKAATALAAAFVEALDLGSAESLLEPSSDMTRTMLEDRLRKKMKTSLLSGK